jgi:hypothetical protein
VAVRQQILRDFGVLVPPFRSIRRTPDALCARFAAADLRSARASPRRRQVWVDRCRLRSFLVAGLGADLADVEQDDAAAAEADEAAIG